MANEAGLPEELGAELRELKELWERDPGFAAMMSSAAIDLTARRASLRKAFGGGRVHKLVLNLLLVMNDKRRTMVLCQVCDAYRRKLDAQFGREIVQVKTALPLTEDQRERLRTEVARLTGHGSDLFEDVDPDVLGGIRIQIADRLYDLSVDRRLRDVRSKLLEEVKKHLLSGVDRFVTQA